MEEQQKKNQVEFIVNVNTSAQKSSPFYSLTSLCDVKFEEDNQTTKGNQNQEFQQASGEELLLVAVKTDKNVAIIELKNGIPLKDVNQLNISGKSINQSICYHSFVYPQAQVISSTSKKNSISAPMYVCFQSGKILVVEALSSAFIYIFNASSDKGDDVWRQKKVTKIITLPDGKRFLVMFSDSTIIEYGLNAKQENFEFQSDINKLESQISFQPKKFGSPIQRKSYGTFEYSSASKSEFIGFACYSLAEDRFCGPNKYYKFKCPSISDFEILPTDHHLYSLVKGHVSREPQLIAFAGLDGILRVIDLVNFWPIYSFKTYYGGINSFTFDKTAEKSPLIAISCQDDSVLILNTRINIYFRIIGHTSFVSHSIFNAVTPEILRIVSASFDGHISISDFYRNYLDDPKIKDPDLEYEYLPLKLKYDPLKSKIIQNHFMSKLNEEGLSYIIGFKDYFSTSAFDGCVSLFKFWDLLPDYKTKYSEDSSSSSYYQGRSSTQSDNTNQQVYRPSEFNEQEDKSNNNNNNNSNNNNKNYHNNYNNNYNNKMQNSINYKQENQSNGMGNPQNSEDPSQQKGNQKQQYENSYMNNSKLTNGRTQNGRQGYN